MFVTGEEVCSGVAVAAFANIVDCMNMKWTMNSRNLIVAVVPPLFQKFGATARDKERGVEFNCGGDPAPFAKFGSNREESREEDDSELKDVWGGGKLAQ